jgi:hypothetical protein
MRIQVGRLMTMLATVVYNLHQPQPGKSSDPWFCRPSRRVWRRARDYVALREALLWTLEHALGVRSHAAIHEAWTVYYENSPVE